MPWRPRTRPAIIGATITALTATAFAAPTAANASVRSNPTTPAGCTKVFKDANGRPVGALCGRKYDGDQLIHIYLKAGWTMREMREAIAVSISEGGCFSASRHWNRNAAGKITSTDFGLWQINTRWHAKYRHWNLDDPVANAKAARQIWLAAGGSSRSAVKKRAAWNTWNAARDALKPGSKALKWADDALAYHRAHG